MQRQGHHKNMTPEERAYFEKALKNAPTTWREELLEMLALLKPETRELLENGPKTGSKL